MGLRFGVQHGVGDPRSTPAMLAPQAVIRYARAVELAGFDALGFTDHPAPSGSWHDNDGEGVSDTFTCLGFCAAVTTRVRLVSFVLVPAYHNPLAIAHRAATLDHLSEGRVTLGLGTGYLKSELYGQGCDFDQRLAVFDERVATMRDAWAGRDITKEGAGYSARSLRVGPPIVQRPHPPLWIHGNSPWGLRRAARWAQGWIGMMIEANSPMLRTTRTTPLPDFDTLSRRIDELRIETEKAGRRVEDVEIIVAGALPMLDVGNGWAPHEWLERLATLQAMGVDWVIALGSGQDPGVAEESVARFGAEVIAAMPRTS